MLNVSVEYDSDKQNLLCGLGAVLCTSFEYDKQFLFTGARGITVTQA